MHMPNQGNFDFHVKIVDFSFFGDEKKTWSLILCRAEQLKHLLVSWNVCTVYIMQIWQFSCY